MQDFIELVRDSLCGQLVELLEGVEDAFEEGRFCDVQYCHMLEAYDRLRKRLNVKNEDGDV